MYKSKHLDQLTDAIKNNDFLTFTAIFSKSPKKWSKVQTRSRRTLIQEAIFHRKYSKTIFNYILDFRDMVDFEASGIFGLTALSTAVHDDDEYYASQLLRKGAFLRKEYSNEWILRHCINKSVYLAELLYFEGIHANVECDCTPYSVLRYISRKYFRHRINEIVPILLFYGADPLVECKSYNAFELSFRNNHPTCVQEMLFLYTFDEFTHYKIHLNVLLQILNKNRSLFNQIWQLDVEYVTDDFTDADYIFVCSSLLSLDLDDLKILLEKCNSAIAEVFHSLHQYLRGPASSMYELISCQQILPKLNLFIESTPNLHKGVISFINSLDSIRLCRFVVNRNNKFVATEILTFMLSHGLQCERQLYDIVFDRYGYCELFYFLLCLDVESRDAVYSKNIVLSMVCDVHLELGSIFQRFNDYSRRSLFEALHFSVNPKLLDFVLENKGNVSDETLDRLKCFPRSPSLVELARNALREHIIKRFKIRNPAHFRSVVSRLPVSDFHKKIILFEAELY